MSYAEASYFNKRDSPAFYAEFRIWQTGQTAVTSFEIIGYDPDRLLMAKSRCASAPVAAEDKCGPIIRRQAVALSGNIVLRNVQTALDFWMLLSFAQHPQLRLAERLKLAHFFLPKVLIKTLHQNLRGAVGNFPQAGND